MPEQDHQGCRGEQDRTAREVVEAAQRLFWVCVVVLVAAATALLFWEVCDA